MYRVKLGKIARHMFRLWARAGSANRALTQPLDHPPRRFRKILDLVGMDEPLIELTRLMLRGRRNDVSTVPAEVDSGSHVRSVRDTLPRVAKVEMTPATSRLHFNRVGECSEEAFDG